jgi:hypothetical protein
MTIRLGLASVVAAVAAAAMLADARPAAATVFAFSGSLTPCAEVGPFGSASFDNNVGPDGLPLTGDENPCGNSANSGNFSATYDDVSKVFSFSFDYTGLTNVPPTLPDDSVPPADADALPDDNPLFDGDPFSAWHIHLGNPGENGEILIDGANIEPPLNDSNPLSDSVVIDDALTSVVGLNVAAFETVLQSTGFYINIHSDAFRQGELRAQIVPIAEPITLSMLGVGLVALGMFRQRRA